MVEDLEEKSSQGFDLPHYLGIVRRRHMQFLIPLLAGWLVVWGASWVLPSRYRSGTLILVEQPTMPKDYVTPNVNDDLQDRLRSITQQILSRTRLLHIIDQLHLYSAAHGNPSPDDQVERMRKDIDIELVRDGEGRVSAFNVSYLSQDPHVAQQVTSELTNLFISENLEVRQQQSEDTTKFLESQLETARKTLADQEEKIREFKGQHVGQLPAQVGSNLQILAGIQSQLQAEEDALNTAKQQRAYLETLVSQNRALPGSSKGDGTAPTGLAAIDQELATLRAQLADLSSHYTDRHPDVRKVKEEIARTEKMRSQLVAQLKAGSSAGTDANSVDAGAQDPSSPLLQLQGQAQANRTEIANREQTIKDLEAKVNDYQARLNQEPVREQQLSDLTRGYDQSKANYDELLKKKNESAMATSMELLQQGERFRIIDPPSLPLKPDFPNRLKFCAIGLAMGLALGTVVAGAFEVMDDRIYDEKEFVKLLPVAVISEIPDISAAADEHAERRRMWLGWATAAIVSVTILLGSALSYLRG
ncbi:MAG TPA: XrtA system polysaccharide chain length determinant [Candidatus Aquilonibacter sp.]|jgi:succinoglycan biosynthesis transport protein ExoP|nr:XrtA system polysaccharide chain length determinant [Candidatus Aquilonibacter sp.]